MSFETSIADDCEIFDFTATVTLQPEDRSSWSESVTNVTKTKLSKEQSAAIGPAIFETEHKRFGLYVSKLNDRVPEQGCYITEDNDAVWQILSAELSTCATRYVCACVKTRLTPTSADRKSTRLNSSHTDISRMPSSA